ncbi:MAG TPA: OmpA family protein [Sphingobacteriaceae bacterium]
MNYSTIRKVVACSLVAVLGVTASYAQDTTMTTTTTTSSSAKVFGGRAQYRTWSIGVNAGVLAPISIISGANDFNDWDMNLGYGLTIRKQLGHAFGLEGAFLRGKVSGANDPGEGPINTPATSFETDLDWSAALTGVVNVATADFLRRENNVNFFLKAGAGIVGYNINVVPGGDQGDRKELFFPVGVGVKFKLSDRVALDLGYTSSFMDADNLDGTWARNDLDTWSYGYGGLDFSLGSSAKPSLEWVNPVAVMYDDLKDPTLRQEVEALKGRVTALEQQDLLKDTDGDGVADRLDKCPDTPAGTQVTGSGCPIEFPVDSTMMGAYENIQFEFDSSVLRTSAYPTLDKVSSDLRSNSSATLTLEGHASAEGTEEYNMNLSRDRANSVKTYLVNSGVDANRITVRALGETKPIASNATEAGRVQNRRVEFKK